jgi:hypothetical protein
MNDFVKPQGINFRCRDGLPASSLSKVLCKTAGFLQGIQPYARLQRYDDWWEHDGLHFHKGAIDFDGLFAIVGSPETLSKAMPGDDDVHVGIATYDNSWYLRFYLYWDEEESDHLGKYDIALPEGLAEGYRDQVLKGSGIEIMEQDSASYYESIIL